jgi:type I restriction enzyme S subunit
MPDEVVYTEYGPMSSSYAHAHLRDLCLPNDGVQTGPFGSQLHASDYVSKGIPIITVEHLGDNRILHSNLPYVSDQDKERLSKYTLRTGDIVFSRVGSVDRRAIVSPEEDGWLFSGRCLRVRPNSEKIDPGYLSWFFGLPSFKEYIRQIAVGATMPSLNTTILENAVIYFPCSLQKQQDIARILCALDGKINLNRRMNETLEAISRALFKSWFVDFDPVRAKAEGRDPGLPKHIADLFPDRFADSEVDKLPLGWEAESFADTVEVIGGGTPKTSVADYWDGDIPWFSVDDAPRGGDVWVVNTGKKITPAGLENSSTRILPDGTTIISARGTVGRVALVGVPMAMNQSCYGLRGKKSERGFFTYFATRALIHNLQQRTHGSIFDTITRDTFKGVTVVSPADIVIQGFEAGVTPMLERIRDNVFESFTLAALRDTLLPKLISGQLRTKRAERLVGRFV